MPGNLTLNEDKNEPSKLILDGDGDKQGKIWRRMEEKLEDEGAVESDEGGTILHCLNFS